MSDTFLSNRREDIDQLIYLLKHKAGVYHQGRKLDVPRIQLLKHDIRKFTPAEWKPYREYWFDKDGPTQQDTNVFREAVKHHKKNNPHHHYKNAPRRVQFEAVADWYSAGPKKDLPFEDWVKKNVGNFPLPENTKKELMAKIGQIGESLLNATKVCTEGKKKST